MKKTILIVVFTIFSIFFLVGDDFMESLPQEIIGYIPPDGFVPNQETAIKIAEAIWLPIYGREVLQQKPYYAKLIDNKIWIVEGTLKRRVGGTAYIEIDKYTGTILKVTHSK
jgi:hypothetical protein